MSPLLWKEEHVFYLKMSSHLIAPSSWHTGLAGLPQLCCHSTVYLSFLAVYPVCSVHLPVQAFAHCFSLLVDGMLHVGRGHVPSTQHCHSVKCCWIKQWVKDSLPIACVCMYMLKYVYAHGVGGGDTGDGACVSEVRGCICFILALWRSQQGSSTQPCQFTKASCKCSLIFLANIPQTALSAWRIPHALLSVVYVMKTMDFVSGFPARMYRIIWNVLFKNYTTTHLFPVPLKT